MITCSQVSRSALHPEGGRVRSGIHQTWRNEPNSQSFQKLLEPLRAERGVAHGVGDVAMAEVLLERAGVVAVVREPVAGGVPEHVRMDGE